VSEDERLRLFLALRMPEDVLDEIEGWQRAELASVRIVPREHLHVTLAFLGHRPAGELDAIVGVLRDAAAGAAEIRLTPVRYRETRSVGMLVFSEDAGAEQLALGLQRDLLGCVERDTWLPHVTVLRFRERPRLQPPLPELEPFVTSEAAAFLSVLRPSGAEYVVLESVYLGGASGSRDVG
jgi:RNA 2',3'-cyclic 3'-phosphodiesterase